MIEFDYSLDYKNTLFEPNDPRYRIGRGERGVLLVRPYTDDICKHWRLEHQESQRKVQRQSIVCTMTTKTNLILSVWICVVSF